ncbi:MAG: 4Fe-4S dicluster domain-containing protein, partial [Clostridia bacterium]|nr:4Fe-4S dicluster domain-containing protein [Clostridia bacterium]
MIFVCEERGDSMRAYETRVQELKDGVLREVARLAWEDRLQTGVLDIPEKIIPGPAATMRCCIYKERAIIGSRVKMALGGDKSNPAVVEVMPIACDECPVSEITVGPACRGCIATRCVQVCPRDAITVVEHRAVIDHSKCIACGKCIAACPYGAIDKNVRPCEKGCKGNAISMGEDKKAAIDENKCISCGTCVYQCPFGAIMDKSFIVDVVQMLRGAEKWGYRVYAAVAPSIVGQFPGTMGQLAEALRRLGLDRVVEVAEGAEEVAREEAAEWHERMARGDRFMTTSCCSAYMTAVRKHVPELQPHLSSTLSPMRVGAAKVR